MQPQGLPTLEFQVRLLFSCLGRKFSPGVLLHPVTDSLTEFDYFDVFGRIFPKDTQEIVAEPALTTLGVFVGGLPLAAALRIARARSTRCLP